MYGCFSGVFLSSGSEPILCFIHGAQIPLILVWPSHKLSRPEPGANVAIHLEPVSVLSWIIFLLSLQTPNHRYEPLVNLWNLNGMNRALGSKTDRSPKISQQPHQKYTLGPPSAPSPSFGTSPDYGDHCSSLQLRQETTLKINQESTQGP